MNIPFDPIFSLLLHVKIKRKNCKFVKYPKKHSFNDILKRIYYYYGEANFIKIFYI